MNDDGPIVKQGDLATYRTVRSGDVKVRVVSATPGARYGRLRPGDRVLVRVAGSRRFPWGEELETSPLHFELLERGER